jgi:predicted small secreted protein
MIKIFFICLMLASLLAGCNTFHGMGKDIERVGETIQSATKKK